MKGSTKQQSNVKPKRKRLPGSNPKSRHMQNMLDSLQESLDKYKSNLASHNKTVEDLKQLFAKNVTSSLEAPTETFELHPVFITKNIDFILDFVNDCQDDVKQKVLDALNDSKKIVDKALFLTVVKGEKFTYIILMSINTLGEEEDGLVLAHSDHLDSIAFFLSELTNLSMQDIKDQFNQ